MSAPGYQLPRDPTAVIGSRSGAWLVDALLVLLLVFFLAPSPLNPFAKYHEIEGTGLDGWDACEVIEDSDDANACFPIGDRVYFTEGGATALPVVALLLYWLLVQGVLQGLTGWTPGKLLFGLRTVGEDGRRPGIGRALLRSLLWIVDAQPCGVPLVGFATGLTSTGHRRVGDMAAKTYVVHASDMGEPIVVPGTPGAYAGAPGYTGYPAYGTPTTYPSPPGAYGGAVPGAGHWGAPPPAGPWSSAPGAPAGGPPTAPPVAPPAERRPAPPVSGEHQIVVPPSAGPEPQRPVPPEVEPVTPATEPAALAPEPQPEPEPEREAETPTPAPEVAVEAVPAPEEAPVQPSASEPSIDTTPSGEVPAVETEVVSVPEAEPTEKAGEPPIHVGPSTPPPEATRPEYNPQWDAARGTYIQWDANRSRWLQWDDAAKEWKPI